MDGFTVLAMSLLSQKDLVSQSVTALDQFTVLE